MTTTATPVFAQTPNVGQMNGALLSTAMTNTKAFDGTDTAGTALGLAYTGGANGSQVDYLCVRLTSTNGNTASGTTSATVVRFWLNNNSANTTATNNQLLPWEVAVPATAVTALATAVLPYYLIPVNLRVPANYKIYAGTTVAVGGTACALLVTAWGGDL